MSRYGSVTGSSVLLEVLRVFKLLKASLEYSFKKFGGESIAEIYRGREAEWGTIRCWVYASNRGGKLQNPCLTTYVL
jgi:hypothetical protein